MTRDQFKFAAEHHLRMAQNCKDAGDKENCKLHSMIAENLIKTVALMVMMQWREE